MEAGVAVAAIVGIAGLVVAATLVAELAVVKLVVAALTVEGLDFVGSAVTAVAAGVKVGNAPTVVVVLVGFAVGAETVVEELEPQAFKINTPITSNEIEKTFNFVLNFQPL